MAVDFETTRKLIQDYSDRVKEFFPVDKAVLFGSYANGNATELSDIDICFFISDFKNARETDVILKLLDLTDNYKGVFFEPIAFQTSEIERGNPFVKEILSTGVVL